MIKLTKKAIELLDAVTSVPYSRKGLGYTIGHGLDAVLHFTCYSYWFSCYFIQRGKLMKALSRTTCRNPNIPQPSYKDYQYFEFYDHFKKITHSPTAPSSK
jgi:hypothetical protein